MSKSLKGRLAIATVCSNWRQVADTYGVGIEIDHYCQAENMDAPRRDKVLALLKKDLETYRAPVLHAPFNELFPAAIDPKALALAKERFLDAARLAQDLGIHRMVVHSGYVPFVYFKEWHIPRSVEFWSEFIAQQPADFEIAIENVLDDEPEMLAKIAEGVNDPRVGVCYDAGHANIVSKAGQDEWMATLAPYLKHLHIHNNDGERDYHRGFTEGTLDIARILDQALAIRRDDRGGRGDITVTAELLKDEGSFVWLKEKGYL